MRRIAMITTAAGLLLGTVARAQITPPPDADNDGPTRKMNLGPLRVKGKLVGPEGQIDIAPPRPVFESHIVVRTNFIPELKKTLSGL